MDWNRVKLQASLCIGAAYVVLTGLLPQAVQSQNWLLAIFEVVGGFGFLLAAVFTWLQRPKAG